MTNEVQIWLNSGAEVNEGLRLLNKYAPNKHLARLVELNPKFKHLLIKALAPEHIVLVQEPPKQTSKSFRTEWSFLREPSCPNELKVLAADKITTYCNYIEAHDALFNCTTNQECYEVAKRVVNNFIENNEIYQELKFYKEHKHILGKHHSFNEQKRINELRKLPLRELIQKQNNIKEAIWRVNSEILKRNKPHLEHKREVSIKAKIAELAEIERLIEQYE